MPSPPAGLLCPLGCVAPVSEGAPIGSRRLRPPVVRTVRRAPMLRAGWPPHRRHRFVGPRCILDPKSEETAATASGVRGTGQVDRSSGWSRQRATQPVGITVTVRRRPHSGQKRGGSRARPHPGHAVAGRPQPVQCAAAAAPAAAALAPVPGSRAEPASGAGTGMAGSAAQRAAVRAPIGMRRSSSIWRSSSADRPSVVR